FEPSLTLWSGSRRGSKVATPFDWRAGVWPRLDRKLGPVGKGGVELDATREGAAQPNAQDFVGRFEAKK
ncbi:MAG: hypothetical protein WBZ51_29950, partial [Xanthobacteraceae bacterium]